MKKLAVGLILVLNLNSSPTKAAQVDLGLTLGQVLNVNNAAISGASVELGTFAGYSDASTTYFDGQTVSSLRASFTSLLALNNAITTDSVGQFYETFETAPTPVNTRLFAWITDTTVGGGWAILSGGNSGVNAAQYNPSWLAPTPSADLGSPIEALTQYSRIFASNAGSYLSIPPTSFDTDGVNLVLVPEPSTGALLMIGTVGLVALRRLRKV